MTLRIPLAALLSAGLLAGPALAQTATSPATPAPLASPPPATTTVPSGSTAMPSGGVSTSPGTRPQAGNDRAGRTALARVEDRIRELHERLHITAAQQAQWDTFAAVMRDNASHMNQVFATRGNPQSMSAVDDLHAYAAMAQAHDQDLQRLVPAFETLYASFSPDQKRAADGAFRDFQKRESRHMGRS